MESIAGTASLDENFIQNFKNSLQGELILPQNNQYEEARQVFIGMIESAPEISV